ncbi:MAG: ATPase, partial [Methanomicrobia archaeon]|nr:ATPase [Methanomicrobia archaeon]
MYTKSIPQVLKELQTTDRGLTQKEAEERIKRYGFNEIEEEKKISILPIFLSQFKDFLMIILMLAIIVSFLIGETADAIVISIILIASGALGFFQEYRAEKSLEMLKKMSSPKAKVNRDGCRLKRC